MVERAGISQLRADELAHAMPIGVLIANGDGTVAFANHELLRMTGYAEHALIGQSIELLVPEARRGTHAADRAKYAADPGPRLMGAGRELHAQRSDGSTFPVEVGLRPAQLDGRPVVIATVVDLSEQMRLEQQFRSVFDVAPYGMLLTTVEGRIEQTNKALRDTFGYGPSELEGQRLDVLLPVRQRRRHGEHLRSFAAAPTPRRMGGGRDLTGLHKDGLEIPVEIGLSTVRTGKGVMLLAAVVDITQRKRSEHALREANLQLEEFSYVASHDLRSPVRGVASLLDFIREDWKDGAPPSVVKNLDRIQERVGRMERLIEDLLTYARAAKRSPKMERVDLASTVADMVKLLPPPEGFTLAIEIDVAPFEGAATPLATVLRNLYANALKHHDRPTGSIAIRAHEEHDTCVIDVSDDGPGIPEAAQQRVFRLFQTLTASERQGTGLGLAVSKRLVEVHGGTIAVLTRDGERGCTFRIHWPRFMRSDLDD